MARGSVVGKRKRAKVSKERAKRPETVQEQNIIVADRQKWRSPVDTLGTKRTK